MSLQDLQEHIRKGSTKIKEQAEKARKAVGVEKVATVVAFASTVVPSMAGEKTHQNQENPANEVRIEQVQTAVSNQSNEQNNTIDLFGVPITQEKGTNGVYNEINGTPISPYELDGKELNKEWKQEEKELFANASEDVVEKVSLAEMADGAAAYYDYENKNITTKYIDISDDVIERLADNYVKNNPSLDENVAKQQFYSAIGMIKELNDPQSLTAKCLRAHEEQHRVNDELGIYAPGLSPEQYAELNKYDEISANVSELNGILTEYNKSLKSGKTKEEALKVFDSDIDKRFTFYKEALANGLDADSKEGKKLMVEGTTKMWQEKYQSHYYNQVTNKGINAVDRSDAATTALGNEKEFNKRISKMFDKICSNEYCKQQGIKSPGNLSQYIGDEKIGLEASEKEVIAEEVENQIGLSADAREQIGDSIKGKTDKGKIKNFLKVLTGRKSPEQVTAKKDNKDKTQNLDMTAQIAKAKQNEQNY